MLTSSTSQCRLFLPLTVNHIIMGWGSGWWSGGWRGPCWWRRRITFIRWYVTVTVKLELATECVITVMHALFISIYTLFTIYLHSLWLYFFGLGSSLSTRTLQALAWAGPGFEPAKARAQGLACISPRPEPPLAEPKPQLLGQARPCPSLVVGMTVEEGQWRGASSMH